MSEYKTPGVFVEEISTLPASIAQVATAVPAMIGYTEKAEKNGDNLALVPTRISSLMEYKKYFGGPENESIHVELVDTVENNLLKERSIKAIEPNPTYKLYYQMQAYFNNGGGPCFVVSVGNYENAIENTALKNGLIKLEEEDEPTIIVFPDAMGVGDPDLFFGLYEDALTQCNKLHDRFTIIDTYSDDPDPQTGAVAQLREKLSSDYLDYGAVYYPFIKSTITFQYQDVDVVIQHTENGQDGPLNQKTLEEIFVDNNELYHLMKTEISKLSVTLPPSATMAGIYARVDRDSGVWKSPANVHLFNTLKPTVKVTDEVQEGLNVDPNEGKSVNAIRSFTGRGILAWGARTLAGNDNAWRYIATRRFFLATEESIKKSTSWAVFEPNDANTWTRVKAQIENYLTRLWRDGALAGAKSNEAFYVHIGLGTTMDEFDILEGKMIVEIGLAVARPAEFIVLRFTHKLQES